MLHDKPKEFEKVDQTMGQLFGVRLEQIKAKMDLPRNGL